jgi:hypothetical protein
MKLRHALFGLFFIVFAASAASAEKFEYRDYEVQKGDTLWDISSAELKDAFQWPLVWRENQQIPNPDRIYPGQHIKIPFRALLPEEMKVQPVAKAKASEEKPAVREIKPVSLTEKEVMTTGYIAMNVPDKGEISGSPSAREMFGKGDSVYLSNTGPVKDGEKFYVIRKGDKVDDPGTGQWLGYLVSVHGVVEVVDAGSEPVEAKVVRVYDVVRKGDVLDTYIGVEPASMEAPRKPQVEGYVVATQYFKLLNGLLDVVYIDRGRDDGLLPGDIVMTLAPDTEDRPNAILQVINAREATASALILNNDEAVSIGQRVTGLK